MQQRRLGSTDIFLSPIGLGTVKFGRTEGVKYPHPFKIPTDAEAKKLLIEAKTLGVNTIDTAPAYGNSEERLGQLISKDERKDWIIITKTGEEFSNGQSSFNFTPEHTQFSIERSLKRLNTDYLDVVLVHSDGNDVYNIKHFGILDCLNTLKQKGIIRSYGMSTKTVEGGILAIENSDVVMVMYNPLHTEEKPVIERAHELQKGILIKKALMSGHIQQFNSVTQDKIFTHNLISEKELNEQKQTQVQRAIQFILQEKSVGAVIIGTININHLNEIICDFIQY